MHNELKGSKNNCTNCQFSKRKLMCYGNGRMLVCSKEDSKNYGDQVDSYDHCSKWKAESFVDLGLQGVNNSGNVEV